MILLIMQSSKKRKKNGLKFVQGGSQVYIFITDVKYIHLIV